MSITSKFIAIGLSTAATVAGATGDPSHASLTTSVNINNTTVNTGASAQMTGGAVSGNINNTSVTTSVINLPPPRIIEIKKDLGSCHGSPWQAFFDAIVVNGMSNPAFGLKSVSDSSISLVMYRKRNESEMKDIADFVQRKMDYVPPSRPPVNDQFSNSSANVAIDGNATSSATTSSNTSVSYVIPKEIKMMTYTCSGYEYKK